MYLILVDNNFISSRGIKALLDKNEINCEVVNCSSREALLDISRKLSADILIIDFDIFAGDAAETIGILRGHSPKAYILGLINYEQYEKLQHAIKLGIDDYMVKPLQINELILRVKIGIRRKENRIEKPAADVRKEPYSAKQGDTGQQLDEEVPVRQVLNYSEEAIIEHETNEIESAFYNNYSEDPQLYKVKQTIQTHISKSFPELPDDRNERKKEKREITLMQETEKEKPESEGDHICHEEKPEKAIGYGNCNSTGVLRKTAVNKLAKRAKNILTFSLLLFLFFLSVFLVQGKISGGATEIAGHRMYVVLSGSMSPALQDLFFLIFIPVALIILLGVRRIFAFQAEAKLAQILKTKTPKKGLIKPSRKYFHVDDADPGKIKAPGRMCHLAK